MTARAVAVAVAIAVTAPHAARAGGADDVQVAADALVRGDYAEAERIAARVVVAGATLAPAIRAEAWRVYGLALFFLGERDRAEAALLEYLKFDPDAVLDPAVVPPEAIRFFDDVRVEHAALLSRYRPRARPRRRWWLNWLPPAGQVQNGDRVKAWVLAGAGGALLTANVASYVWLRRLCDDRGDTCVDGSGRDRFDDARVLRGVNLGSAVGLAAWYAFGVIDGVWGYRRARARDAAAETALIAQPTETGWQVILVGQF